jgi:glycosyltransferase involved in cell wall biosynthesis
MTRMMISVIVPVFGNSDTLMELERRLGETLAGTGASFEIIFVDDHSPDGSWTVIEEIAAAGGGRTRGLRLAQNVGQHMAVLTGLSEARGTRCVVLDADLQDPPEAIPDLLGPEFHDYGAVFAGRRGDYAPPGRLFTSALYRRLLSRVSGVPLDAGMFFAIAQEDVRRLLDLRISKASLVAMIGLSGIRSTSVPVSRSVRNSGRSAYSGVLRLRLAMDMLRCVLEWRMRLVRRPIGAQVRSLSSTSLRASSRATVGCPELGVGGRRL